MARWEAVALVLCLLGTTPALSASGHPPGPTPAAVDPGVSAAIADVSLQRIYSDLYALQNFSTRYAYSTGFVRAGQYIFDAFSANPALQVGFQDFDFQGVPMRNVVAVLPGTDPTVHEIYVVGAHYDSTSRDSDPMTTAPGADDDGSGTAAVLEAARVLSGYRLNATLVFATWGAEEEGLVGSGFYCECLAGGYAPVGLDVNLDMIGNDPSDAGGLQVIHDTPSEWAADRFIGLVAEYGLGLAPTKVFSLTANSDHASFWAQGYPAVLLIEQNFSPVYHSSADTVDRVNMRFVTETARGAVATLAALAGIHGRSRGTVLFDRGAYGVEGVAGVRLDDEDLNANPALAESATVTLTSPQEPAGETLTLTESGRDTGFFTGALQLTGAPGVPGTLQVAGGVTIAVTYADASPAGVVTDTATIDGTVPAIRNVAAAPDVDRATVSWETSEPADALVAYGTTLPLGSVATDPRPLTAHRVDLVGLAPDTEYRFDARSTDDAGQTATADNAGLHFRFHTLTGATAIPDPGHAGYVTTATPATNDFGGNRILSGYSTMTGYTYRGAAQFNTAGMAIPAQATLTNATLHLYGRAWVYDDGPGAWQVEVLNASADPGWTSADYAGIAGAAVDFQIPPTLLTADLVPGQWEALSIPSARFPDVKARVGTGALSIRIDGPTGPPGRIFEWATGYPLPCPALDPRHPELSVTFSRTGDVVGPRITALRADPNPVWGASTNLTATASDADTGGTPIARVESFLDADPGAGQGSPMGAADGAFDGVTEGAVHVLDAAPLAAGTHTVGVRAQDAAGNWGPAASFTLYVRARDPDPPTIVRVYADPPVAELGLGTTLGAVVTDTLGVAGVDFAVRDASGSPIGNFSAALNASSGGWESTRAYPEGTHGFTAWARDTGGNLVSAPGAFEVRGGGPRAEAGPDARVETGQTVALDGTSSTDDVAIVRWQWRVVGPGGTWTFNTSVAAFTPPTAGVYVATLQVWDAAGRTATDTANVTVAEPAGALMLAWWPVLLVVLVALSAVAVIVAWRRRKRERPPTPPA